MISFHQEQAFSNITASHQKPQAESQEKQNERWFKTSESKSIRVSQPAPKGTCLCLTYWTPHWVFPSLAFEDWLKSGGEYVCF